MFNNDNPNTNGENMFYNSIKHLLNVIFDVGSRSDSLFNNFEGEVHYFEPVVEFIYALMAQPTRNRKSYYNNFGLGNENTQAFYYPKYQSFYDRVNSCKVSDEDNKITLQIKKANDYINEKNIQRIDFLKIDTEGYEMNVLQGFGDSLKKVQVIQFEYGGTFLDNKIKLIDVINYLKSQGFHKFSYLAPNGYSPITDFTDHYQYCNIVCINVNSDLNIL